MASTQETAPLLEKSVAGSDIPNAQLAGLRKSGMIDAYQRLVDDFTVWTRFIPVETVGYETWEQWIYQNHQSDSNTLDPHPHVVGTAFPMSSIEEPSITQVAMGGYANRVPIPAGYWRFRKGPEDPIARVREIQLVNWVDWFASRSMTDITNDFTTATDDGSYDDYLDNATGGYNSTVTFNQVQLDSGYEFDTDGDPLNFFLDLATVINSQHKIRSLSGRIPMRASNCVVLTDEITLGKIKKKFVNDEIYYDRVNIGDGIRVPEAGGFTFLADDAALGGVSATWNSSASTKGFAVVFQPSRVPFYAKQYFLGAEGWDRISVPNSTIGFGLETYVDKIREGNVELLFQAYFKNVILRPDELFVLGNLRSA